MANFLEPVVALQIMLHQKSFLESSTQVRRLTSGHVGSFFMPSYVGHYHLMTSMYQLYFARSNVSMIRYVNIDRLQSRTIILIRECNFNITVYHSHFISPLAGVFPIPDYLNKSVVTLLCHMLQIDPMKRATAEDIHKHEWFQKDLPTYLFPDRDAYVQMMDHETVGVVCEVSISTIFSDLVDKSINFNELEISHF